MKLSLFDYHLPPELIAQKPLETRSESKLLIMGLKRLHHRHFTDLINYLNPGDVLVLNDTKVIKARMFGVKETTGAKVELLLLNLPDNKGEVDALVGNSKVVKIDTIINIENLIYAKCINVFADGIIKFRLSSGQDLFDAIEQIGRIPLPPYIKESLIDDNRYQTVYANNIGSSAAPTAGLHFTTDFLTLLQEKGVIVTNLTLHVGLDTFRPIKTDDIDDHQMHSEYYQITENTAIILNTAKKKNKRIFAVGTTSLRALESNYLKNYYFTPESSNTKLFLYPPKTVKSIDALITNFHLPKSSLLLLISTLTSREYILDSYQVAISNKYRFFSFGDACLIFNQHCQDKLESSSSTTTLHKKKLLLHTCCAVCLASGVDNLVNNYDITCYFSNNNVDTKEEFELRLSNLEKFINCYNKEHNSNIKLIVNNYQPYGFVNNIEEGNYNCFDCFKRRIASTHEYAIKNNFDYFSTTLSAGINKDARIINKIGIHQGDTLYLPLDFKKNNGQINSKKYCQEYRIYRQNYCGCLKRN